MFQQVVRRALNQRMIQWIKYKRPMENRIEPIGNSVLNPVIQKFKEHEEH